MNPGSKTPSRLPDVSVVVIGRNEGTRLLRCLAAIHAADWGDLHHEVIYVDSGSTDGSPQQAQTLGARVLLLNSPRPSAAAGRNLGWRAAQAPLVLFLDGDTVLHPQFVARALSRLTDPVLAAVWGHRREINPGQSVYTRVLDLDWVFPTGRSDYFGGDVLVRRRALLQVGGFDDSLVAGEEPELCRRLREQGWEIDHADLPMTGHDLAITTARAWWKRAERAGLAYAQVSERFAQTHDPLWQREARRNGIHGPVVMAAPALLLMLAFVSLPWAGLALLAGMVLWLRSAWRSRWKCPGQPLLALAYAFHAHAQQVPIYLGQRRYARLKQRQEAPRLVEYKGPSPDKV